MTSPMLWKLVEKEFRTEVRQRSSLAGLAIYVGSSVFICYSAVSLRAGGPDAPTWSALYWIMMLFSGLGIVGKGFLAETRGAQLYLHSLVSPGMLILSKIIYSTILGLLLMLTGFLLFIVLMGNPVQDLWIFLACITLGAAGFGSTFSLLSGIASRAGNSNVLMAIMGFPVILSVLLLCIRVTRNCIDGLGLYASQDELLLLAAVEAIAVSLSYILFPYIWRS